MCKFQKFTVLTILILAIGFFIGSYLFSSVWLSTSSPNKTYKVELTGDKERGGFIIPSVVGYKVIKENQVIAENLSIHSGDWMDISFELAYPEHTWISENVIRFWRNSHLPEEKDKTDTLLISNDTDKTINI